MEIFQVLQHFWGNIDKSTGGPGIRPVKKHFLCFWYADKSTGNPRVTTQKLRGHLGRKEGKEELKETVRRV